MKVDGTHYRSIWLNEDGWRVDIIDQTRLPHEFEIVTLETLEDAARAIEVMQVRGAPLIGATAAYGICLALREEASDEALEAADARLRRTRPTAINLMWALDEMLAAVRNLPRENRLAAAYARAAEICDQDVATNEAIGRNGLKIIEEIAAKNRARPSTSSPTAMPAGSPRWIGAPRLPPSTWRTTRESRCTSGPTRPGPATRAQH